MSAPEVSTAVQRWRIALVGLGILLLLLAGVTLLQEVPPTRYVGIAAWLLGAVIIHDGIVAMAIFAASVLVRRVDRRIPPVVIAIVQGGVLVGVTVTVIVLPEIVKKAIGTANPSILPLDYLGNLGLFYAGLAAVTAVLVALAAVLSRFGVVSARRRRIR